MQKTSRHIILLGLITVFLAGLIVRYQFAPFPLGNIDCYIYVGDAIAIKNNAMIPWLLHPLYSFIGIYPASDTTGFMVFQSANYIVLNTDTILYSNIPFSIFTILLMLLGVFLLGRFFIRHPICQLLPPFFFLTCAVSIKETLFFVLGSRGVGTMFFILFLLVIFTMQKLKKMRKIQWLVLALLIALGGILNHLLFVYFLPVFVLALLLGIFAKKVVAIAVCVVPKGTTLAKYSSWFGLGMLGICVLLPFVGITPVSSYRTFYASVQVISYSTKVNLPWENPIITLIPTYIQLTTPLIGLSALGAILFMMKYRRSTDYQLMFVIFACIILIFELGYFIYLFSVILALLAGICMDILLKKGEKLYIPVLLIIFTAPGFLVYSYRIFRDDVPLYLLSFIIPLIIMLYYRGLLLNCWHERKKAIGIGCAILLILTAPGFAIEYFNSDLTKVRVQESYAVPPNRPTDNIVSLAFHQKFFGCDKRFISTAGDMYVTTVTLSEGRMLAWECVLENQQIKENFSVSSVSWEYNKPKTFFAAKYAASNFTLDGTTSIGSPILGRMPDEAVTIAHHFDVHYIHEFIPLEGKGYLSGAKNVIAQPVYRSPLFEYGNQHFYVVYQNDKMRSYYF